MTAPKIHTYHCLCLTLLLASTHTLLSLPRRSSTSGSLDNSIILPLPHAPTSTPEDESEAQDLAPEGYTLLLGLDKDKKNTIVRREDGFEKRILYRCSRCRLVVGYEMAREGQDTEMAGMGEEKGKGKEQGYTGKVIYILPAGVMSTESMATGRKIEESDMNIVNGGVAVFE